MFRWMVLALAVGACAGGPKEEPPKKGGADKAACELKLDGLDGKGFVLNKKLTSGALEEDLLARVRFSKDGDTIKAKYTTRALSDVYDYTCSLAKDELSCWQDDVKPDNFCRALVANGKECTADAVAQLTGLKAEGLVAAVEETKKAIAAMTPKDRTDMMALYSSANKPLRGVMHIKIKKSPCGLNLSDMYQYMSNGQLKEVENVVGTATFLETSKELVWDHCADGVNLVFAETPEARPKPGETLMDLKVGQAITARYVGAEHAKAEAGCTYAMDTFGSIERLGAKLPVSAGADGALDWSFSHSFMKAGHGVAHMVRYRTCEGKPEEKVGVSCQVAKVK